jgi:HSP20 family protein
MQGDMIMTEKEMQVQRKQEVQQSGEPTKNERQFVPAVDIFETDQAVTVVAEKPGVDKGGVDIHLENDTLTIRGDRTREAKENEMLLLQEYEPGCFMRRFTVSETIDQGKIAATMTDGILTVVLPKVEPAKPRKILVKGA